MQLEKFPDYYKKYSWNEKHKLFGYPADTYPNYDWIFSLEKRFIWLCNNSKNEVTSSKYLINEMIQWGGSQNGVLQKFNDRSGEVNLYDLVQKIIENIDDPEKAISSALTMPGLGLTYASKLLRFMNPSKYGALDSRIRKALLEKQIMNKKIYDGNKNSMVRGYVEFVNILNDLEEQLTEKNIEKPNCSLSSSGKWRPSEIEMALFSWSESS